MQPSEAAQLFDRAEVAGYDPDQCAAGRWQCHMLLGEFEKAWQESDAISSRGQPDHNRFWDGKPANGKSVLIRCLHGLGDTLQFLRYVPLLRQQARTVVIEAQPAMKSLIEAARIADQVITWGQPEPFWNQQIEIIELPRVFRTTLQTIPQNVPYIAVPQSAAVTGSDGNLRVALNWASSRFNPERSIRLEQLRPILTVPSAMFFSIQADPEREQLQELRHLVIDRYDPSGCILSAAVTIAQMDLVITVDTMLAHLAGALGKRVWTLLPFECDWRWMLNRRDSPWYPSMTLFRQPRPGAWEAVVMQVAERLAKLARSFKLSASGRTVLSSQEAAPAR